MPERDGYIPGVPCWIDTSQPDPASAVDFYSGLFGWEFEDVMPPESEAKYFIARLHGGDVAAVGSIPESAPSAAMWNTYIWVESADETASKVREAGGGVVMEPFDVMDAGRMAVFTDPEGAAFCVWQAKEHKGARVVNEPGSLNFNDLNTRDVEGAKSFYGSVFGWETLGLEGGFEMWTLPGYGDYLERDNPDIRKRMADIGAVAGFEDVVASLGPIADDQPDVAGALGRDVRGRRRRRNGEEGRRARRHGDRPTVRCSVGPDDRPRRPAGRDLHREQVRARTRDSRQPGGRGGRGRLNGRGSAKAGPPYDGEAGARSPALALGAHHGRFGARLVGLRGDFHHEQDLRLASCGDWRCALEGSIPGPRRVDGPRLAAIPAQALVRASRTSRRPRPAGRRHGRRPRRDVSPSRRPGTTRRLSCSDGEHERGLVTCTEDHVLRVRRAMEEVPRP